ncbi:DUF3159 domain-containing protein [Agrococcus sp. SGAir0287]|uniref:DUF3159 domain-containing protein n=1 Tax=Agrococcus sp. SGAir0287 TaxID=2070347 RepID=UPI0010CCE736|nr:DUF3159 domain-containing protein [Agrococcus sp. SGAir0287]QCR18202.1 DUF3159 domain-containing protein [Agrococcus sp. SGAir0287]
MSQRQEEHALRATATRDSLPDLLGGRRSAIEASIPPAAFLVGWLAGGALPGSLTLWLGCGAAVLASLVIAIVGLAQGRRPRAVVVGLLAVVVAALVAAHTGEARDFFLIRLLSNAASALAWAGSIVVRWPLLGLIVGAVVGTRTRWRRDPVLLRAYQRASWIWVLQYVVRLAVFVPLWLLDLPGALAFFQAVLTYPLVAACLVVSGVVLVRSIPHGHPGIRHPRAPEERAATASGTPDDA